jgi:catechol 2,3-dioxygenase-like lactoylglutathione lyase family enzyme
MEITKGHITIYADNMDASIHFYQSIGFHLDERWENHYAQLSASNLEIGIHPHADDAEESGPKWKGNVSIGMTCKHYENAKKELESLGIAVEERNGKGGHFLSFKDPSGTDLYFYNR